MANATARTWAAAAILALAAGSAAGARRTTSLDAVVAELETRLASETDAKRRKWLQQALKALGGPHVPSFLGDVAAMKAAAAKLPRLRLAEGDPLFALIDEALGRLRAEASAEISRLHHQVYSQEDAARRATGKKAIDAANAALDKAGDDALPLAARVAGLKKAFAQVAAGRRSIKAETVLCDSGGLFSATIHGTRVTPLLAGGEITSTATGELTHVGLLAYTRDATQFLGYHEVLSLDFAGASFQGVGTYAITAAGPVRAYWRDRTQQFDATEGSITVTSWDPASRRVEGTFAFRTVDGSGATTLEATGGTFLACELYAFTSQ
jgi:hypothetical protein